tara:strand:+ start:41401 stop:41700 length:300 start_codon:yes stop_codon:yes gene_type:complete
MAAFDPKVGDFITVKGPVFDGANEATVMKITRVNAGTGSNKSCDGTIWGLNGAVSITGVISDTTRSLVAGYAAQGVPIDTETLVDATRKADSIWELDRI